MQSRIANAGTSGRAANRVIQTRRLPKASRSASPGCGDPFAREAVMIAPGVPHRAGPAAHCGGVLVRPVPGDIGDRDLSASARDGGLFEMARAREPALDAPVHLFRPVVLDRDRDACEMRGERTAGEDVPLVLTGVAVDGETAHRRVARVLERAKAEVFEGSLARFSAADEGAAVGQGLALCGLARR